jgi:hypothetical protein
MAMGRRNEGQEALLVAVAGLPRLGGQPFQERPGS